MTIDYKVRENEQSATTGMSRRRFLGLLGLGVAGVVAGVKRAEAQETYKEVRNKNGILVQKMYDSDGDWEFDTKVLYDHSGRMLETRYTLAGNF